MAVATVHTGAARRLPARSGPSCWPRWPPGSGRHREARWIVDHAVAATDGEPGAVRDAALALADRRAAGEPLQYVLGTWAFRSLELAVDRRVLIPVPRPSRWWRWPWPSWPGCASGRDPAGDPLVCVDLGTGSGAIALSLAVEGASPGLPLEVWATDASPDALDVADGQPGRTGRRRSGRRRPGDVRRRVVVRGPARPAGRPGRPGRRQSAVRGRGRSTPTSIPACATGSRGRPWWPPRGAAAWPAWPTSRRWWPGAGAWLRPSGALVVELAPSQAYAAIDAARRAGFSAVGTARDLAGRLRMLVAVR